MLVDTDAGTLYVSSTGEGPDVILWHSLLCDSGMWRYQLEALRDDFRLHAIDAPGHGRSRPTTRPYGMDDCVAAARQVMDALELSRASWCGLSWGGMVGMRLAARSPERVASLALFDTSARGERLYKKLAYRPLGGFARRFGPVRPLAKLLVPLFFARRTQRERPDLVEQFISTLSAMEPESLHHAVDAVIHGRDDVLGELGAVRAETVVFVGEEDSATPLGEAKRLTEAIAGAELFTVPDASHLSALERPDLVNPRLRTLFASAD